MTLPADFVSYTQKLLGDEFLSLEMALQTEAPTSIRMNPAKSLFSLDYERVPWSETGYYLPERLAFTFDPLFHAGTYYVQEASSMFLQQALKAYVTEPVTCLDLCAAPGGKSTHLLDSLPPDSLLVSNEVIKNRSWVLSENITKWGHPATIVTNNEPADFGKLTHFFDVLLTDVPCSGEGMFRKDPDSINEWSLSNVKLCAARQKRILQDAWATLKPGGLLIYSTCTYNTEENEENIHYIISELGADPLPVPVEKNWNISSALAYDYPVYRFFPHKTKGEGFFLAVLRKREDGLLPAKRKTGKEKKKNQLPLPAEVNKWLSHPDKFWLENLNGIIRAFPLFYEDAFRYLSSQLHIVSSGIAVGEQKGKDILPSHALAMSTEIHTGAFDKAEVNWEDAIKYLRKEVLSLPNDKGFVLINYQDTPLGFVKQLGNRANNLYPQEWRIRSGYMPQDIIPALKRKNKE